MSREVQGTLLIFLVENEIRTVLTFLVFTFISKVRHKVRHIWKKFSK